MLHQKMADLSVAASDPGKFRVAQKLVQTDALQLSVVRVMGIDLRHLVFRNQLEHGIAQDRDALYVLVAEFKERTQHSGTVVPSDQSVAIQARLVENSQKGHVEGVIVCGDLGRKHLLRQEKPVQVPSDRCARCFWDVEKM
jgi:hypothetical protein